MAALGAAIGAAISTVSAAVAGSAFLTSIVGRLLISVVASSLLQALAPKPKAPGIRSSVTQTGGIQPLAFPLGRYATGGTHACPPMTQGSAGDTPNAYLTYVIVLSDIPGSTLDALIVNDDEIALGATETSVYGRPMLGKYNGYGWVKYHDGSQIAADPMLLAKFAGYAPRPWQADMIGTGLCYAIVTFRFKSSIWSGLPRCRFVLGGVPLYDPRKDSTVGGSGTHLWTDPATWEPSSNSFVQTYNVMRGIAMPDGSTWGGAFPAEDLPLASWIAGMNECDVAVDDGAGGTEPQYRTGYEVAVSDEPADVIAELLKGCSGQVSDVGGVWKGRAGGPGLPAFVFTDEDVLISSTQDYRPFPGLDQTFNGVHANYPEPASLWEPKDAPPRYDAAFEAEDQGQRLVADLTLTAVPYAAQVQRLMLAYLAEERRFRRHGFSLPAEAAVLEPLDAVAWTSARNGYTAKVFEVTEVSDDLRTCVQRLGLRERDVGDYAVDPGAFLPVEPAPPGAVEPAAQAVPGFAADPATVLNSAGDPRGPAIRLSWTAAEADDVEQLRWEVRPVDQTFTLRGVADVSAGEVIVSSAILRAGLYEARAELIADRATLWTAWLTVAAPAVGSVTPEDLIEDLFIGRFRADYIGVGKMNARHLEVTELLEIDADNAGLSLGKVSAFDQSVPGIFFGTTAISTGFGFLAGREGAGGEPQYVQINDETALTIVNARHLITSTSTPAEVAVAASQTVTLPVNTITLDLTMIGGGGGGGSGQYPGGPAAVAGSNGGDTIVQIYDGAVYTGISWTAPGGQGKGLFAQQPQQGGFGENSSLGNGGAGGRQTSGTLSAAGAGTGYGAGGGGGHGDVLYSPPYWLTGYGAQGGSKSGLITVSGFDISALANPKLVITVGPGGVGGISTEPGKPVGRDGAAGSPGIVNYIAYETVYKVADVVPLSPTATGSFLKPSGGTNNFPNLGAGFWLLDTGSANTRLFLDTVEISPAGDTIYLRENRSAGFFAGKTPKNLSSNITAVTVFYKFHAMGSWGGS